MPSQYKPFSHFSVIRNFSNLQSSRSLQITLVGRNLFNDKQYVFRLARSAAGVLTAITNRISEALYNRYISRTIASGISKVWQNGLLQKLSRQGLPGSVFIFLFQLFYFFLFLTVRYIKVAFGGQSSGDIAIDVAVTLGSLSEQIHLIILHK